MGWYKYRNGEQRLTPAEKQKRYRERLANRQVETEALAALARFLHEVTFTRASNGDEFAKDMLGLNAAGTLAKFARCTELGNVTDFTRLPAKKPRKRAIK